VPPQAEVARRAFSCKQRFSAWFRPACRGKTLTLLWPY
jgi:hypothetical protein